MPSESQPLQVAPGRAEATISADGKCLEVSSSLNSLIANKQLESLELIIDGHQLVSGHMSPTLLGKNHTYLEQSLVFQIQRFEPMADGRCKLLYNLRQ